MYVTAVRGGVVRRKYSRDQFDVCKHILLNENDLKLNAEVSDIINVDVTGT